MSTIKAGLDLFETPAGTASFLIPSGMAIPAHFFHEGSVPFAGIIHFDGFPLRLVTDPRSGKKHKSGTADTAVFRKQDVTINSIPGSGTTEIELVQLSLRSSRAIEVQVGRGVQRWDVHVSVSSSRPSTWTMTITQTSAHGGIFAAEMHVWPLFRFERRSDGEERHLDMGALKFPDDKQELVVRLNTLQTSEAVWQESLPEDEIAFRNPELTGNFAIPQPVYHVGPHPVVRHGLPF